MKSILFDLDGTLLDTLQDLTDSVNHALSAEGLPLRQPQEVRKLLGNGYQYLLTEAAGTPAKTDAHLSSRLLATFREHYETHCLDKTVPYNGITELLQSCRSEGWKLAVISNKGQQAASTLVERFFGELVDFTVGESPSVRRKPAPDTLLQAMRQLTSTPDETVFVGDSEVDIMAANAAGVRCLSCLWGFRDADVLTDAGARYLYATPAELLAGLLKISQEDNQC